MALRTSAPPANGAPREAASPCAAPLGCRRVRSDPGLGLGSVRPPQDRRFQVPSVAATADIAEDPLGLKAAGEAPGLGHFLALTLAATGVTFGDIGTSPLYTFNGIWVSAIPNASPTREDILGSFSMIFWVLTWVTSVKYVCVLMRANDHGEGGMFAVMHLILSAGGSESARGDGTLLRPRARAAVVFLAIVGCSMLAGDSCITPAMSVLSALEGIPVEIGLTWHVLLACAILLGLFSLQRHGSQVIGSFAGPVMVLWFAAIGALGLYNLAQNPEAASDVLGAISPVSIYEFWVRGRYRGLGAWRSLAGVVMAVTGAEALYADMGHFGAAPISLAWFGLIYPCLVLQYMGQAAVLSVAPAGVASPFFAAVPDPLRWPMVVLATVATVLASQSLISGLFSLFSQAHALKMLPRIMVKHTNPDQQGQVYIPELNWLLCIICIAICVAFRTSTRLAGAFGVAVTSTFLISTLLLWLVLRCVWRWRLAPALLLITPMFVVDVLLWSANMTKVFDGGWVTLAISAAVCGVMLTYSWGRQREELVMAGEAAVEAAQMQLSGSLAELGTLSTMPALHALLRSGAVRRSEKVAIFLTTSETRVPRTVGTLADFLGCLPETIVLLSVRFEEVPFVREGQRATFTAYGAGVFGVVLHFGYCEPLTAERFAIRTALARVGWEHAGQHPQLRPLQELDRGDGGKANVSLAGPANIGDIGSLEEGGARRPQPQPQPGGARKPCSPFFVLHKPHYAVQPGTEHGLADRLRTALYSWMVLNARKPISFFGLEDARTIELASIRFL